MSAPGWHRWAFSLGYGLYGLSVAAISYFVISQGLFSTPTRTLAEVYFVMPGALFIRDLFPPHSGPGFFPAVILSNAFMYLVVPPVVVEIIRRTRGGRMGWRDLLRFIILFALWGCVTLPRGGNCFTAWDTLKILRGLDDWWGLPREVPLEGFVVVTAALLWSDRLAARLLGSRAGSAPFQAGRRPGLVSLGMAAAVVAAWGLFGIVHCWPPAWR